MPGPDTTVFVEPSFRAFQPWTPQLLLGAELLCDGGTLRAAADLCEQMLGDDRLLGILNKRVQGVFGLDLTFEPARGRKSPVKALEADEDWWAIFSEEELCEICKWGFLLGVGVGALHWVPRGKRIVPVLVAWHPRHLTWDWTARTWKIRVEGQGDIPITPGDGKWVLFTPYGGKRPWAKGLWRALSRWWLLKQYAIFDWGKYSERHGQGAFVAEPLPGSSPGLGDRKQLAADLQQLARAANIAMPPGYTLKLVEATANNWETFKAQKECADLAYAVSLLGNNLSTEVTGGSYAAADVHKVVEATVLRFTAKTASEFTHDQVLSWWAEFNFGSADVAPWARWAVDPPEDLQAFSTLLVSFGQSLKAFAQFKIPVDVQSLCDRFQIPLVVGAPVPEMLEAPPPPPSPFGAPPPKAPEDEDTKDGTEDDDPEETNDEEGESSGKSAAPGRHVRVRTKAAASNPNKTDGRAYAGKLAANAKASASKALAPNVKAVLEALSAADDFPDLRKRLLKAYRGMDPRELQKVVYGAAILSQLAGRASAKVNE